jgi:hypothetical protein
MIVFWILAAVMLVSDTAVYLYYLRPAENALASIESEYQMKRAERKPEIEGPAKKARELKRIYRELPRWEDFTRVMGEVYNKAERLNLLISSVSYQPSRHDSGLVQVITMPVTGPWISKGLFIFRSLSQIFIIETFLSAAERGGGRYILNLTIGHILKDKMSSRKPVSLSSCFWSGCVVVYRVATRSLKGQKFTYKPGAGSQQAEGPISETKKFVRVEKRAYRGVIRNPFQALYPPVVISKPTPPPMLPAPVILAPTGPSPEQIESERFRFLGFLQREGESKIFLSRDKEVFIVKKGDSVTIFQVADITDNSVTLLSRDSKEEFKLIIEDIKPTKPELMPGSGRR